MKAWVKTFIGVVIVGLILGGAYLLKQTLTGKVASTPNDLTIPEKKIAPLPANANQAAIQATPAAPEGGPRYPIPKNSDAHPKLSLDESDAIFEKALFDLFGQGQVEMIFKMNDLVRRLSVLIENASEKEIPEDLTPFNVLSGSFATTSSDGKLFIDPKNSVRYTPYTNLIKALNVKKLAALYFDFYPVFQSAYHDINPKKYFNDRVIQVIDHLISTPDPRGPLEVVAFNRSYHYADPALESLSVSQKTVLRLGSENEVILKEKLGKLRNLLILGE